MYDALREVLPALVLGCSPTSGSDAEPVQLGIVRTVDEARLADPGNCHIGGLPGRYGEDLDDPYPGAATWSAKLGPPAFKSEVPIRCD